MNIFFLWAAPSVREEARLVVLILALLVVWTAIGVLPLPGGVVEALSSVAYDATSEARRLLLMPSGGWMSLSLDRGATLIEVVKWSSYAWVVLLAATLSRKRGLDSVLAVVGGVVVVLALIALVHALLSMDKAFGLYAARSGVTLLGPIVNPNNLAGFMNLGAFSWWGLFLARDPKWPRPMCAVATILCVVTLILSASRAGVASFMLGGIGLGCVVFFRRGPVGVARTGLISSFALLTVGVAIGVVGLTRSAARILFDDDLSKLKALFELGPALRDSSWVGIGRGAFDAVSAHYMPQMAPKVYRSIECFPLNWAIEWGAPVALLALVGFGMALSPRRLATGRSSRATAAFTGLCVLLIQNLFDLGLELYSLSLCAWALVGGLVGSSASHGGVRGEAPLLSTRSLRGLAGLGALAALFAAPLGPSVFEARDRIYARFHAGPPEQFLHEAKAATLRYPLEPYFPLLLALRALDDGQQDLTWASAALRRAPDTGRPHLVAALLLAERGAQAQALGELRRAAELDSSLIDEAVRLAVRWSSDRRTLERAVPRNEAAGQFLWRLSWIEAAYLSPFERRRDLERAYEVNPESVRIMSSLLFEKVSDLKLGRAPCDKGWCPLSDADGLRAKLNEGVARLRVLDPGFSAATRLEAELLRLEGRLGTADELLAENCGRFRDAFDCARLRVEIVETIPDPKVRGRAERAFVALACVQPAKCAEAEAWLGARAANRGDWANAAARFRVAAGRDPSAARWLAAARAAALAEDAVAAQVALERARHLGPTDPEVEALVRAARARAVREVIR